MHKIIPTDNLVASRLLISELRSCLRTMQTIIRRSDERLSSNEADLIADSEMLLAKVDRYILNDMNQSLR
jgi:hypothetical protein